MQTAEPRGEYSPLAQPVGRPVGSGHAEPAGHALQLTAPYDE